jgi:1-hydroxycarotenoid 3,4-desaturase
VRGHRIVVIGAGIGGLTAATEMASAGADVMVLERAAGPGGKMHQTNVAGVAVDSGPTVLTMRWALEDVFATAGTRLEDHLDLVPASVLARHAWAGSPVLDLFVDLERSADAVGQFAGAAEARHFLEFHAEARRIYDVLRDPFIRNSRPTPFSLTRRVGLTHLGDLFAIRPYETLWRALGRHFRDARLRQLYGRYATYCGSSPYAAPATLMLVAHVEQEGVWLVSGGMQRIAAALAKLAQSCGATVRYGADVAAIVAERGRVAAVTLADGTRIAADAVICNADAAALGDGRFGAPAARGLAAVPPGRRSLSAVTWAMSARASGFPLQRHNVFFSDDYRAEFDDIFTRRRLPASPTVYVCAQDRDGTGPSTADGAERLLCLVNAPATGDAGAFSAEEMDRCEAVTHQHLQRLGLTIDRHPERIRVTTPQAFEQLFPSTGGALYGQASHGWRASFTRPGSRARLPGLYLAGGSTHPGPGVPMAALSGRLAAASLLADLASTSRSSRVAMPGGISMR